MTLDRSVRNELWKAIDELVRRHRSFADAPWAMPAEDVDRLAAIGDLLKPGDVVTAHLWLFESDVPQLGTGKRSDVANYRELLAEARNAAVEKIFGEEGVSGLYRLSKAVDRPWSIGLAAASIDLPLDMELRDLLDNDDPKMVELSFAYCAGRTESDASWMEDSIEYLEGRSVAQARLLLGLDDLPRAWELASRAGDAVESAYWREFRTHGRGPDFAYANEAAGKLLSNGRPGAALDLLNLYLEPETEGNSAELIATALEALIALPASDPELRFVSEYEIERLLDYLRNSSMDEDRVALLEWGLLPAMGFQAASPTLHHKLARDPAFFVQILSLCFKPKTGEDIEVPQGVAENAFRLLREWRTVPGTLASGGVDEILLKEWISTARELLREADRLSIGEVYIGHVMAHAPGDEDGTWPALAVRNTIEWAASNSLEEGLSVEIYNKRGTTSRGLTDGGTQERDLAAHYLEQSQRLADRWPRTAAVLRNIAQGYERDAKREDENAERFLRGHKR